jgi:predicted metalloprotease with PDZ domain
MENVVAEVCRCSVKAFFDAHVRGGSPMDLARYLRLAGLRIDVAAIPVARDGIALPDLRVVGFNREGSRDVYLRLFDPASAWGRAGLHSGDLIVSMNGAAITSWPELRSLLTSLHIGDTVAVVVSRPSGPFTTRVSVTGYDRPDVKLAAITDASAKQKAIRERWMQGW